MRTTVPSKALLSQELVPFAIANPASPAKKRSKGNGSKLDGPTTYTYVVATARLLRCICLYDGTSSFLNLLNDKYKLSYSLKDIRQTCGFESTRHIYAFVLGAVNLVPKKPIDLKFRSGWASSNLPVGKCSTIGAFMRPKQISGETAPLNLETHTEGINASPTPLEDLESVKSAEKAKPFKRPLDDDNNVKTIPLNVPSPLRKHHRKDIQEEHSVHKLSGKLDVGTGGTSSIQLMANFVMAFRNGVA